jgi:hypothetical protein
METFMSPAEIVQDILHSLHDKDREKILALNAEEMIWQQMGWGNHIRNFYKLWDPENPYTLKDYQPTMIKSDCGFVDINTKHPDVVSMDIMKRVWSQLQVERIEQLNAPKDIA